MRADRVTIIDISTTLLLAMLRKTREEIILLEDVADREVDRIHP